MTTFTQDAATINAEWNRITGRSDDWSGHMQRHKYFFALTDPDGLLLFWSDNRRRCDASIYATPGASGASVRDMVNRGFRWVFERTPVYVMRGEVAKDNARMLALIPHINGIFLASETDTTNTYKITLASLAKQYGPKTVIDAIRAAGNSAKADRLQAAYDAWLARQP